MHRKNLNQQITVMNNFVLIIICSLSLAACKNLVPYTDALRQNHNWSDAQIKKIQFYTSREIVLQRQLSQDETVIQGGKIKIKDGRKIEEIIIQRGTPGIAIAVPSKDRIEVSFEKDDNHYLRFGINPNAGTKFTLLATDWNNGIGKVNYSGKTYYTSPDAAYTILMVDLRKIQKTELNQRVAKGRKVQ